MPINDNISDFLRRYKAEHRLSIEKLSAQLCIGKNTAVDYLNGSGNPRADTIEFLAEKCGVSVEEMISAHPLGWEQAEIVKQAARVFSDLPPDRQEKGIQLFLAFIRLYSDGNLT